MRSTRPSSEPERPDRHLGRSADRGAPTERVRRLGGVRGEPRVAEREPTDAVLSPAQNAMYVFASRASEVDVWEELIHLAIVRCEHASGVGEGVVVANNPTGTSRSRTRRRERSSSRASRPRKPTSTTSSWGRARPRRTRRRPRWGPLGRPRSGHGCHRSRWPRRGAIATSRSRSSRVRPDERHARLDHEPRRLSVGHPQHRHGERHLYAHRQFPGR